MNELIKELALQAKRETSLYGGKPGDREFDERFNKKFAELIVQECVNVLHDNELWNRHISHALKEHFGVEE